MELGGLVPWFGAKRTLAPKLMEYIGPHTVYWEPFCASMSVLFAKWKVGVEIVNDLHSDLINLALTIQHPIEGPRLYRRLRRVYNSQEQFELALTQLESNESGPDRAFNYFIVSWQGLNGFGGLKKINKSYAVRYESQGGSNCKRWVGAVGSIPHFRDRLAHVQILHRDGLELCERIEDKQGTVIYCDPPYIKKAAEYLHDFDRSKHIRLARALSRFKKTRVIVSYYDDPLLDELYDSTWVRHRIDANKNTGEPVQELVLVKNPFK